MLAFCSLLLGSGPLTDAEEGITTVVVRSQGEAQEG